MPELANHHHALNWRDIAWQRIVTLLCLGFSAGVPILLIFSTLSLWLGEAGVKKSAVTMFSWAALGYSFKFVWAPIIDKLPLPFLRGLGRRRSWMLLSQLAVMAAIVWMANINPAGGDTALKMMAMAAVLLGFSSATQDICIDAYRIECAPKNEQALLSSCYVAGYRVGMIVAGAGALLLADSLGTTKALYLYSAWKTTYLAMALVMLVGMCTTLVIAEPKARDSQGTYPYSTIDYSRLFSLFCLCVVALVIVFNGYAGFEIDVDSQHKKLLSFVNGALQLLLAIIAAILVGVLGSKTGIANKQMVRESYVDPIADFLRRYGTLALWILLLVGFYRVSDIVLGVISNVFYQDLGYSKTQIGSITKAFGLVMVILGSFIGGFVSLKIGVMRVLLLGAVLSALTNLLFAWLATTTALVTTTATTISAAGAITEPSIAALTVVIAVDNLCAGLAVAAFVAWLSSLTSIEFTATQYAIFSSLMTLFPKVLGGYSGTIVASVGYSNFFIFTALLGLPVIILTIYLQRRLSH